MDKDCKRNILGELRSDYLSVNSHSSVPGVNLHAQTSHLDAGDPVMSTKDFYRPFPYDVTYPLPSFPPTKISSSELNGLDPSLDLVRQKKKWENNKALLLKSCKDLPNEAKKEIHAADTSAEKVEIPRNVTMLAHHLKSDPDKEFTGNYNWYYGGGNMETISIAEKKYLVRPGSISDGCIYLTSLEVKQGKWTPMLKDSFMIQVQKCQPVYQIDSSGSDLLVRQKGLCHYMEATEGSELHVSNPYTMFSDVPLVSASLNIIKPGEFCTLTTSRQLAISHVASHRYLSHGVVPVRNIVSDRWASVHYIDAHSLFIADRKTVGLIDLRDRIDKLSKFWDIKTQICDEFCTIGQGACSYQYVGTKHYLLGLDLRQGFTQQWTHSLPHNPTVLKVLSRNDMVDTVFIGSQRSDAVVSVENRWDEGEKPLSKSHPRALPTLRETLHLSRSQGHSLSHTLTARFTMCLTGICCFEDEDINLLRSSSIGDVFWQRLLKRGVGGNISELSKDDYQVLDQWETKCELLLKFSQTKVTAVTSADHLIQKMNDASGSEKKDSIRIVNEQSESEKWKISKKKLFKYCDYLAPKLLEAWDLDDEPEWRSGESASHSEQDSSSEEDNFTEKVKNWIDAYSSEMKMNEEYKLDCEGEEEGAVGYDHSRLSEPDLCGPGDDSFTKPSPTKKRKSYVSGF